MNLISNLDLWNLLRQKYPNFASHTSKGTKETFTEAGFEALQRSDVSAVNEFYELSLRVFLQVVNISQAKDPFDINDVGETFANPYGGYIQRLAIPSVKPVSPGWKGLTDGQSVDPFVVHKSKAKERFFKQNFDYQSLITIPDVETYKNMFISEFGMSEAFAGWLKGLENGYILQKYVSKLEVLNTMINSAQYPLQSSQIVDVPLSDEPTAEELTNLWLAFKNTVSAIESAPQTDAFNAYRFASTQDTSRLRLVIRQGLKNRLASKVLASAFNPSQIGLSEDIRIVEVANFGGLQPFGGYDPEAATQGVYTFTVGGTVASGDKLVVGGITTTLNATSAASAAAAATAVGASLEADSTFSAKYAVSVTNAVVTVTENRGYYGAGRPASSITSTNGTLTAATTTAGVNAYSTPLYPVYDTLGHQIGYATSENQTAATHSNEDPTLLPVYFKDPNEDTIAVLMDKGAIFTSTQNPYSVRPIINPRGLYTNYWASAPGNTIAGDPLYNFIVFNAVPNT